MTKVGIEWEDPKNYDDWDTIATAIYSSVVARPIKYTAEEESFGALAPYDLVLPNYAAASFLYSPQFGREAVFLRLECSETPFDTAVFCRVNPDGTPTPNRERGAVRQMQFLALLRSENEEREIMNVVFRED